MGFEESAMKAMGIKGENNESEAANRRQAFRTSRTAFILLVPAYLKTPAVGSKIN